MMTFPDVLRSSATCTHPFGPSTSMSASNRASQSRFNRKLSGSRQGRPSACTSTAMMHPRCYKVRGIHECLQQMLSESAGNTSASMSASNECDSESPGTSTSRAPPTSASGLQSTSASMGTSTGTSRDVSGKIRHPTESSMVLVNSPVSTLKCRQPTQ